MALPPNLGYFYFPGIDRIERGSFTLSHGITPSVATLEITPQKGFTALIGPLTAYYNGTVFALPDCRLDQSSFRYDRSGFVWHLSVKDRRWKWAFGSISGHYNQRFTRTLNPVTSSYVGVGDPLPSGSIDPWTLRTPQQLCTLCLKAMGETLFDVSQVPNDSRPQVDWEGDNPAQCLQSLCDLLGCRVVYRLDNTVQICRNGIGRPLPPGYIEGDALAFQVPQRPDRIRVQCGKTRYQTEFVLEAVGMDIDGSVVPIDQLSYKPSQGWGKKGASCLGLFFDIPGHEIPAGVPNQCVDIFNGVNRNPRALARETVFRWYRISMVAADEQGYSKGLTPLIPSWGRINGLWQILPIEDVQVEGYYDPAGEYKPFPAIVYGNYEAACGLGKTNYFGDPAYAAPNGSWYQGPFSIDKDRGIVMFDSPVYKSTAAGGDVFAADLYLRCAVSVRSSGDLVHSRYFQDFIYPDPVGTLPRILKHDEITLNVVPVYSGTLRNVKEVRTNVAQVKAECNYYLAAAVQEYVINAPQDKTYIGLLPINPDGAIQQITWDVNENGHSTRASRGTEWNPVVPPYNERKQMAHLGMLLKNAPKLLKSARGEGGR